MPPVVHSALVASILISALGAVVTCLLVTRYGLAGGDDCTDPHRLVIVRVGHALAVVCFAASAILIMAALARAPRPSGPSVDPRLPALAQRLAALESRLDGTDRGLAQTAPRLERVEAQVGAAEDGLRRIGDDLAQLRSRLVVARPVGRTVAAPLRTESLASTRPTQTPAPSPAPRTLETSQAPGASAAPPPPLPAVRAPIVSSPPASAAPPRVVDAAPLDADKKHLAGPDKRGAAVTDGAPLTGRKDDGNLSSHIKRDWATIKRGFTNAGNDFRTAVEELGRNLRGGK